jgi:hypothetical protein
MRCPFCKRDPFHYVDIGVGYEAVAVECCDLGIELIQHRSKKARQALALMRSHSPRKKARAKRMIDAAQEYGGFPTTARLGFSGRRA